VLAESRDPKRVREVWEGWHAAAQPMKAKYSRFVELSNKGAKTLGYADTGVMWRSRYDMPADAFAAEFERLWTQLRPLYQSLHAYVRTRLHAKYGDAVPATGPIPAHLLGNIWAQDWSKVFDLVKPAGASAGVPLDSILKARKLTAVDMTRYAEGFFVSLGMPKLPQTFWDRSLLVKPRDREVVCHANAWAINFVDDIRIKMCVDPTAEDFLTLHHELGHDYYFLAYNTLPPILRDGANDGFHEAIGDTIALSVTPEYLVKVGLLDKAPDASGDIPLLLQRALEKLSFLPFGFVVDQWRWKVFSGEIAPEAYNTAWWDLRLRYQGIAPPSPRGGEFFDPGAKYHIPDNTPYAPLLPGRGAAAAVSSGARQGRRLPPAAAPLLHLWQRRSRQAAAGGAGHGCVAPLARRSGGAHGRAADGRERDGRILRTAQGVARRAEQGRDYRLVVFGPPLALRTGGGALICVGPWEWRS
jgi:peptidyl-dipeptidase A